MTTDKEAIEIAQNLQDYCKRQEYCDDCPFRCRYGQTNVYSCKLIDWPSKWDIPTHEIDKEKEPKKMKRVPFDFSKKEDRDALRGRWITNNDGFEKVCDCFYRNMAEEWVTNEYTGLQLYCRGYVFLDGEDAGQLVSKLVEVEE